MFQNAAIVQARNEIIRGAHRAHSVGAGWPDPNFKNLKETRLHSRHPLSLFRASSQDRLQDRSHPGRTINYPQVYTTCRVLLFQPELSFSKLFFARHRFRQTFSMVAAQQSAGVRTCFWCWNPRTSRRRAYWPDLTESELSLSSTHKRNQSTSPSYLRPHPKSSQKNHPFPRA